MLLHKMCVCVCVFLVHHSVISSVGKTTGQKFRLAPIFRSIIRLFCLFGTYKRYNFSIFAIAFLTDWRNIRYPKLTQKL